MKAAVVREIGKIGVEEIERPSPAIGEVLVRMVAAGVCHTDGLALEGSLGLPLPAVLGHEGAGVVEEVGAGVNSVVPGDHVVLSISYGCGTCFQCQHGAYGLCETGIPCAMTGSMPDGTSRLRAGDDRLSHFLFQSSFAEYAVVPAACAVRVRSDAPLRVAALLACGASTGYGAVVRRAQVRPGTSVLVIGAGGVGLAVVMSAALAGATTIIAADRNPEALALAAELGATHTVEVGDGEPPTVAEAHLITGRGVDYAFDVVGATGTLEQAFHATRHGGDIIAIGATRMDLTATVPVYPLIYQKRLTGTVNGSISPHLDIPAALDAFMAGRLPLDRLITRTYDLSQIDTALADLHGCTGRGVVTF
jgi:Zn-dependent alcohol dehydrogenase